MWEEGDYVDAWTIPHILSGAWAAGISIFLGLDFWVGLLVSILVMIAWEVFEVWKGIHEWLGNKIADVVTGVIGFLIVYPIQIKIDYWERIFLFSWIFIVYLSFVIFGYIAYLRKSGRISI